MAVEIRLAGSAAASNRFVGWAPVPADIRLTAPAGGPDPLPVTVRNRATGRGGRLVFRGGIPGAATPSIDLDLPQGGAAVSFAVAGEFGRPSLSDGDAVIEVVNRSTGAVLQTAALMVRIRKNANRLTAAERDRFIAALARLNNGGLGRFQDFRNVHTSLASPEAHGNAGFLPWHRALLLDLERELQAIDPSVALPYWRFDQPAPSVFTRAFMGVPNNATGTIEFSPSNPLQFWVTDGIPGIARRPQFNTATRPADVLSERGTLSLGGQQNLYRSFRAMEDDPHGSAHTSFTGSIASIGTAAKDPLFFLLHANVDRLWARWQWMGKRFDPTDLKAFSSPGVGGDNSPPGRARKGHELNDSMWPWNLDVAPPRPNTAPGGPMASSPLTAAPGPAPTVRSMIDYQGTRTPGDRLGFDYDDVPYQ